MKEFLFVYGTLRRGGTNAHHLANAEFVGEAHSVRPMGFWIEEYPIVSPLAPRQPVFGEIFRVTPGELAAIDEFEGAPDLYRREEEEFQLLAGGRATAWIYFIATLE